MIESISHITFVVKDLEKAKTFFELIFEAEEVYSSGENTFSLGSEKYFLINDLWIIIMKGESQLSESYNHIAFKVDEDDYKKYETRIRKLGLVIKPSRKRVNGEGKSLYFFDFDNHLFEIHTGSLSERLLHYSNHS